MGQKLPILPPFVLLVARTAHAMEGDAKGVLPSGMGVYRAKPVAWSSLDQVLWRVGRGQ